ncbi:MAG: NAD(P)-binding domain-containing protein [Alphaproteobacteria bacterium]|nr:NAD(P)-binding domain-containing protein [Alphaproteobacteria bacterium]
MDVVVIGGGQAGLSASACLAQKGIEHVVLEKSEIGASWRHRRWDSFCLVTPNWTVRLPGQDYDGTDPDGFMSGGSFVEFLERYAEDFNMPLRCPVEATGAVPIDGGWLLATTDGPIKCRAIIVATSNYQRPYLPPCAANVKPGILSLNAPDYRAPAQLPPGRILVVGSAQSGGQIVEDLLIGGRDVVLSVSRAGRVPRRYRGRDAIDWQNRLGLLDRAATALDDPRKRFGGEPLMTGRDGGHTLSLQDFHRRGVRLVGRVEGIEGAALSLKSDLRDNIQRADQFAANFCRDVDDHIAQNIGQYGLTAPLDEGEASHAAVTAMTDYEEPRHLDLADEGVSAVIWATGFRFDFNWIKADVFDDYGYPVTARGETTEPGLFFLGLNYLHSRKSGIIYGVGDDARYVCERVQRGLE